MGHLKLIKKISRSSLGFNDKMMLYSRIFFSQVRWVFDIGLPVLSVYLILAGVYNYLVPIVAYISASLLIVSLFIWDTYGFVYRKIFRYTNPETSFFNVFWQSLKLMVFLPIFIIMQAIPRITALYKCIFQPNKTLWYKTERTKEAVGV